MKKNTLLFIIFLISAACQRQPQQTNQHTRPLNKFFDATIQQIYTLQDTRNTADLLPYLEHGNPSYRKEAALAFASVQDTLAVPQLLAMLSDTAATARQSAGYALGQIGHSKAESLLLHHLNQESKPQVQAVLLEALGKVATSVGVNYLARYNAPNPVAMAGQAWGLYRAGLRQQHSFMAVQKAVSLLAEANTFHARLGAAHFLARTPKIDINSFKQLLISAAASDKAPEVRMAIAQALAKLTTPDKATLLSRIAQNDPDYRVRLNAIRSMSGLGFSAIGEAITAGLLDENVNTAIATSEFLQANYLMVDAGYLYRLMTQIQDGRVRANLAWTILRKSPNKEFFSAQFKQYYVNARDPYNKAHFLKALAGHYDNYKYIEEQIFKAQHPVVATNGLESLVNMRQQPDFPIRLEEAFAVTFQRAIRSGDVALVGLSAGILRDPKLNFRTQYTNYSFLKEAQQKLVLPRDMETNIELQKTIDFLTGKKDTESPQNPFTHPINWDLVKTIPAKQQVLIKTGKGDITLQLFVEDAPGSVANFVELAKLQFFDSLYFHRVVPNFVAQGGDKRGDGWGSSDYSIRSEFAPLNYLEGYVGMASAGKDTESNQWFITHSPAPHLDGRYTVFARVVKGMEVVHQLKVGDRIIKVEVR